MKYTQASIKLIFGFILFLNAFTTSAQVTIGSAHAPNPGAILDLKQNNNLGPNSTKGLLLPRIILTDMTSLIDINDVDWSNIDQYGGLTVYNCQATEEECYTIPTGVYVWYMDHWQGLGVKVMQTGEDNRQAEAETIHKLIQENPSLGDYISVNLTTWEITDSTGEYIRYNYACETPIIDFIYLHLENSTTVDLGAFKNLKGVTITAEHLTSIDVSKNAKLEEIRIMSNEFSRLENLENNTKLTRLTLDGGKFTSIDLSKAKELYEFTCHNTLLTSIDLSNLSKLERIDLSSNENLTTVKLANCTSLGSVHVSRNKISELDLTNCTQLYDLRCENNQIQQLNLSACNNLQDLDCSSNQLKTLDLSNNPKINSLNFSYNQIENINLAHMSDLYYLYCNNNKLKTLNVSNSLFLNYLNCNNNLLTILDLQNNKRIKSLYCIQNNLGEASVTICQTTINNISTGYISPQKWDPIYNKVQCQ